MNIVNILIKPILFISLIFILFSACTKTDMTISSRTEILASNWKMQAEEKLSGIEDKTISQNEFSTLKWLEAVVPGTVLGSMATTGVIEKPYFGINMQSVDYEQFKQPWWFRTSFKITNEDLKKDISLRFNGINYRADLWVNGKKVVGKDTFAGTFRMFTFNINEFALEGENTVALKIWQHADGEYSIGFFDWNPLPRDRNMGIFRDVILEVMESVKINSPFVYAKVNKENLKDAELFIQAELTNRADHAVEGILRADFEIASIEQKVNLKAGETISCKFTPKDFKQLSVKDVNLWWPNGMGKANLYNLKLDFIVNNKIIDRVEKKYGIREITSYFDENKNRAFKVNGKFVLLKGGGWVDDLLLQDTKESLEAQLKYIHHMNLNSIRSEGFWGKDETLYDLCDEYGILIMIGWSCHWEWESSLLKPTHKKYGGAVNDEDIKLLAASWKDQMLWLRNHPSIYIWMLGSDLIPAPKLERKYVELFKKYDPSRSYSTSAGGVGTDTDTVIVDVALVSEISGPTGMKMLGPYAFTPPQYWFTDTKLGGAYGFNTETCPGPNIPPLASLQKMFPKDKLWPIDKDYWEYHTGRKPFKTLDRYREALNARYGKSSSIEEFAFKSQVSNYELMRPMFEAFIAHKPKSTGLVQWMLNSAWPELYWQLYDTYLQPNGAFYAVRKACNPLHAIYRYGFDDIYIANESLQDANDITIKIKAFDINSNEIFTDDWNGSIKTNISKQIYELPEIKNLTNVWFLDLRVFDKNNNLLDNSIYWLPLKKDILDYEASKKLDWAYYTPTSQFADYSDLDKLPKVELEYKFNYEKDEENGIVKLTVKNPSESIAFFIFFDLIDSDNGNPILPIYWNDNYVSLLPGEEQTYEAKYFLTNSSGKKPIIKVKAWNVNKITIN